MSREEFEASPWDTAKESSAPKQIVLQFPSNGVSLGIIAAGTLVVLVAAGFMFASSVSNEAIASTLDTDGDGVSDPDDVFPGDASEWRDTDFDGTGDNSDLDDDGDGYSDFDELQRCLPHSDALDFSDYPFDTDGDGVCNTIDDDDDGDGFSDEIDQFPLDGTEWYDTDGDGIGNTLDTDDDNDGYPDVYDDLPLDPTDWSDLDGDGLGDIIDADDDGDTYGDLIDEFPRNALEWIDFDGDGIGDNADLDDDDDGVSDDEDVNDHSDSAIALTIHSFELMDSLDIFDDVSEIYFCVEVNGVNIGCSPTAEEQNYYSMTSFSSIEINSFFFYDLPEQTSLHTIELSVWDSDPFLDDRVDINSDDNQETFVFQLNSSIAVVSEQHSVTASGVGDNDGYDGILEFSYEFKDLRVMNNPAFEWVFNYETYTLQLDFEYSLYRDFKMLDHSTNSWDDYQRFVTPSEHYVIDLATTLRDMAISSGYDTDFGIATFLLAFVGSIPYQYDIDGMGVNEYPKYPIEMLWEHAGDCEDAAALYLSLIESIGFDGVLMLLLVKSSENEDWGGHAMPVVHIPGHAGGEGVELSDPSKSGQVYLFAEATAWYDGYSGIGENNWYAMDEIHLYDVE
ncbi:MAG: hypothetical protein CMA63_03920 [Euryarchaeota archaeon]|nr:hypothetical protein [Euryarchaeota archaeon]|tara:strand:- start:312 stop:2177 length:1866 start_codon:yes stop_codon:yes gene_type:complete